MSITELGSIEISGNHPWVNLWNLALASLIKSNHNMNSTPSNIKALALICYITNYITKSKCGQYQHIINDVFI